MNQNEYNYLLQKFSAECKKYLFKSEVTNDLKELKDFAGSIPWFIVSEETKMSLERFSNLKI